MKLVSVSMMRPSFAPMLRNHWGAIKQEQLELSEKLKLADQATAIPLKGYIEIGRAHV